MPRLLARLLSRPSPLAGTRVDAVLYHDVLMVLVFVVRLDPLIGDEAVGDATWKVLRAEVADRGSPTSSQSLGTWRETWFVERGGRIRPFRITFTPDETGTGFAIEPPDHGPAEEKDPAPPEGFEHTSA